MSLSFLCRFHGRYYILHFPLFISFSQVALKIRFLSIFFGKKRWKINWLQNTFDEFPMILLNVSTTIYISSRAIWDSTDKEYLRRQSLNFLYHQWFTHSLRFYYVHTCLNKLSPYLFKLLDLWRWGSFWLGKL